jgi:putative NADH-flavin reductase
MICRGASLYSAKLQNYSILYSVELSIPNMNNYVDTETRRARGRGTGAGLNLVVLGATGGTGLEIVRQAIERGHSVTALVRSPDRLKPFRDRIAVKQGDPLNSAELEPVIEGHDAVLSGFGPRVPVSKAEAHLLEQFAVALTRAMPRAGVRRVVVESVAFLFRNSIFPPAYLLGRLLFPTVVADASAMERVFADSGLDWTMVRPPELTDKPYTGKYRVREGHLPLFGFKISRADVADFMIRVAENRSSIRKVVGVSN